MLREGEHQPRHDDGDRDENVCHRAAEARENHQERPVPWHGRTNRRRPGIPDQHGETHENDGGRSREEANAFPHANPPFDALVRLSNRYPVVGSQPVTVASSRTQRPSAVRAMKTRRSTASTTSWGCGGTPASWINVSSRTSAAAALFAWTVVRPPGCPVFHAFKSASV